MADARPTLTRRSYEPGASDWDAPSWGPVLMIAESGTVVVDIDAIVVATVRRAADAVEGDPTTIFPVKTPTPVTLAPGDVLTVAEPAKIETRNESEAPAAVLVLTLQRSSLHRSDGICAVSPAPGGPHVRAGGGRRGGGQCRNGRRLDRSRRPRPGDGPGAPPGHWPGTDAGGTRHPDAARRRRLALGAPAERASDDHRGDNGGRGGPGPRRPGGSRRILPERRVHAARALRRECAHRQTSEGT